MANIRLHCTHIERVFWRTMNAKHIRDSLSLNGITLDSASTMCFKKSGMFEIQTCSIICFSNEVLLCYSAWLGNASTRSETSPTSCYRYDIPGRVTILVASSSSYHGSYRVSIPNRILKRLKDDDASSFSPSIAIGSVIKAIATTVRREEFEVGHWPHAIRVKD